MSTHNWCAFVHHTHTHTRIHTLECSGLCNVTIDLCWTLPPLVSMKRGGTSLPDQSQLTPTGCAFDFYGITQVSHVHNNQHCRASITTAHSCELWSIGIYEGAFILGYKIPDTFITSALDTWRSKI